MPHTYSVSVCIFVGIGSRYENDAQAGVSHFIEHMLFKGTPKQATSRVISETIEGIGGSLNGGTDKEVTLYWARIPQPHFHLALDVLLDMILNSRFDLEDIEKERQVIIEEMRMTRDSPSQQVHMLIDEILWPDHPLGRDIAGSKESIDLITRDIMLNYLEKNYSPINTVVAIAGNIQHLEAVNAVNDVIGARNSSYPSPEYLAYANRSNPKLLIEQRDTEQAHICLALPGLPLCDPKRFTLDLLNMILGEGMSSRLFTEIRDNLGLVYSIHSYNDHLLDSGSFSIYAGVEPGNLQVAIKAITEQLSLLKEPIPEVEVLKAKEMSKGRLLLRTEDTRSVAGWMGGQEVLTGNILTVDEVVSIIDVITPDQLNALARELIVSDLLRLAVVGPVGDGDSLEELLKL